MTGGHPDVSSENVSRLWRKRERKFDVWQEEVLLPQRIHERTPRDKGVVADGEIVEEVSGLVPPPRHEPIHSTTANQFLVPDVALIYLPPFVRELLYSLNHLTECASSALTYHGFAQHPKQYWLARQRQPTTADGSACQRVASQSEELKLDGWTRCGGKHQCALPLCTWTPVQLSAECSLCPVRFSGRWCVNPQATLHLAQDEAVREVRAFQHRVLQDVGQCGGQHVAPHHTHEAISQQLPVTHVDEGVLRALDLDGEMRSQKKPSETWQEIVTTKSGGARNPFFKLTKNIKMMLSSTLQATSVYLCSTTTVRSIASMKLETTARTSPHRKHAIIV